MLYYYYYKWLIDLYIWKNIAVPNIVMGCFGITQPCPAERHPVKWLEPKDRDEDDEPKAKKAQGWLRSVL